MNIHLPAVLGFTRYQGFDPSPYVQSQCVWLPFAPLFHGLRQNLACSWEEERKKCRNLGNIGEPFGHHLMPLWFSSASSLSLKMEHFPEIRGYFGGFFEVLLQKKAVKIATKFVAGDLHAIHSPRLRWLLGLFLFCLGSACYALLGILSQLSKSPDGKPGQLIGTIWSGPGFYSWPPPVWLGYILGWNESTSEFWKPLLGYENWVPFLINSLGSTPLF